jgi:hypothetical protein
MTDELVTAIERMTRDDRRLTCKHLAQTLAGSDDLPSVGKTTIHKIRQHRGENSSISSWRHGIIWKSAS